MIYTVIKKSSNGKKFQLEDKSGDTEWYEAAENVAKFNKWTKEGSKVEANVKDGEITYMKNLSPKSSGGGKSWGGGNSVDNEAKQESITKAVAFKGAVDIVVALINAKEVAQTDVKDTTKEIFEDLSTILNAETKKKPKVDEAKEDNKKDDDDDDDDDGSWVAISSCFNLGKE